MSEKLDSFSKILLATGTINYLASIIEEVNKDMKVFASPGNVHAAGVQRREAALETALYHLKEVMEALGNAMNEVCPIDQYVTTPAFNVLIHGHDDVEIDHENL